MLKEQFEYINSEERNPLEVNENDIADACPDLLLIDNDKEDDEDVDLEIDIVYKKKKNLSTIDIWFLCFPKSSFFVISAPLD